MSVPQRHHYLPSFYIERWARGGQVWTFRRPRGVGHKLDIKPKAPGAIGFERNLYTYPNIAEPAARQAIELRFLQRIDARAADVFKKLDSRSAFNVADSVALTQFLLSLLHRSPSRLDWLRQSIKENLEGDGSTDSDIETLIDRSALDLFVDLVSSREMVARISAMAIYRIPVTSCRFDLMTSDRPTMMSNGLLEPRSFLMIPADPRALLIVTADEAVVDSFASQIPRALAKAVNDAVTVQARHFVLATTPRRSFVSKRFLTKASLTGAGLNSTDGMVRWVAP